jgi:hypothetical protein
MLIFNKKIEINRFYNFIKIIYFIKKQISNISNKLFLKKWRKKNQ